MRITVIGCGYLGAVHAACMAKLGHEVVGVDVDEFKIAELALAREHHSLSLASRIFLGKSKRQVVYRSRLICLRPKEMLCTSFVLVLPKRREKMLLT